MGSEAVIFQQFLNTGETGWHDHAVTGVDAVDGVILAGWDLKLVEVLEVGTINVFTSN